MNIKVFKMLWRREVKQQSSRDTARAHSNRWVAKEGRSGPVADTELSRKDIRHSALHRKAK